MQTMKMSNIFSLLKLHPYLIVLDEIVGSSLIFKLTVRTRLHAGRAELLRTEITLRFFSSSI